MDKKWEGSGNEVVGGPLKGEGGKKGEGVCGRHVLMGWRRGLPGHWGIGQASMRQQQL